MNSKFFYAGVITLGVGFLAFLAVLALRPGLVGQQIGQRGIGMEVVLTEEQVAEAEAANQPIEELYPWTEPTPGEQRAGDIYQNVQVLGHLTDANFNRLMAHMTEWVAPEQGCAYCHAGADEGNFADDDLYTKVVSRRMIQMTQTINAEWSDHVGVGGEGGAGVNCYTCHRGNNVPEYIWFEDPGIETTRFTQLGWRRGQNLVSEAAGYSSMETDPFSPYLTKVMEEDNIRVQQQHALPQPGADRAPIQDAEGTYALMIHMSTSLGVNCTYCHNSAQFGVWERSTPVRTTAWYGIRMARVINQEYLTPLRPVYPLHRLGDATMDAPKANCSTCHQGIPKPMYGADMISGFPSLAEPGPQDPSGPRAYLGSNDQSYVPPEFPWYDPETAEARAAAIWAEQAEQMAEGDGGGMDAPASN